MYTTWRAALLLTTAVGLAGCAAASGEQYYNYPPDEPNTVQEQKTPYDRALSCIRTRVAGKEKVSLGVGPTGDKTGKYNLDAGTGYFITQGWADMVTGAFVNAGAFEMVERQATEILEWELQMADKRRLGDGKKRVDSDGDGQPDRTIEWRPIRAGSVVGSDYYVTGSVHTLDFNIRSGGARVRVAGVGPSARNFVSTVGFDLRVVNTRTGEIIANETIQKDIYGYEVEAGVGRFFGTVLVDVQAGVKEVEPMNLALREMTKLAVLGLTQEVYGLPRDTCRDVIKEMEQAEPKEQEARAEPKRSRFLKDRETG